MAYVRIGEEDPQLGGLSCGPGCQCAPCRSAQLSDFADFGERYIPDESHLEPERPLPEPLERDEGKEKKGDEKEKPEAKEQERGRGRGGRPGRRGGWRRGRRGAGGDALEGLRWFVGTPPGSESFSMRGLGLGVWPGGDAMYTTGVQGLEGLYDASRLAELDPSWLGQAAPTLPRVTNTVFVAATTTPATTTHADNCCTICPVRLGVGVDGTGRNGMEFQFTLAGHRPGFEYDILRTRRNSLWERRAGAWTRLESQPMGTNDDHHQDDECLVPRNNRIFVEDRPGFPVALPAPAGTIFVGATGARTHADAQDVVLRASFAEWVITRNRKEGIPWTKITPFLAWHTINWLTRNAAGQWVMDRGRSRIARGRLTAAVINAAPGP